MGKIMAFCLLGFVSLASAADKVCVRHYNVDSSISPCDRFPENYTRVVRYKAESPTEEDRGGICTRIYGPSYCEISPKEYRWVQSEAGESICTLHYDQKGVAELCKDLPDFYDWALGASAP